MNPVAPARGERRLLRRYVARLYAQPELVAADDLVSSDFIAEHPLAPAPVRGPGGLVQLLSAAREAFPDLRLTIHQIVRRDNQFLANVTLHGTDRSKHAGIAVFRVLDRKIIQDTVAEGLLGTMTARGWKSSDEMDAAVRVAHGREDQDVAPDN